MALWWCQLFTAGMSLVVATKIAFIGWGIGIRSLDFTGFGGHSMRATVVIPVRFYLILQKAPPIARTSGVSLGTVFGVIIGISRLVVYAHSVSEAVAGCILGGHGEPQPYLDFRTVAKLRSVSFTHRIEPDCIACGPEHCAERLRTWPRYRLCITGLCTGRDIGRDPGHYRTVAHFFYRAYAGRARAIGKRGPGQHLLRRCFQAGEQQMPVLAEDGCAEIT